MSKTVSVHRFMSRLAALVIFVGSASLMGLAAQPPREMEDPKAKIQKKINVEDDDTAPTKKRVNFDDDPLLSRGAESFSNTPPDVRLDELVKASERVHSNALKEVIYKYIYPFDRITEGGGTLNVKPIPFVRAFWKGVETIPVTPMEAGGKLKETRYPKISDIKKVEHFETLVLEEVERLQKQKLEGSSVADQLSTAEILLSAATRFHEYSRIARKTDNRPVNLRRGEGWDEIGNPLAARLRATQLELLKALVASNDQTRLRELINRLRVKYPKDGEIAQAVAGVRLGEAERLLKAGTDQDVINAKRLLDELEETYPGVGGENGRKLRTQITELARKALKRAQEKADVGDEKTARDELARAISFDADIDGIREMQKRLRLNYSALLVGVRQHPVNMSPSTARLDSEKHAVELMFEGLMEEVPDRSGAVQYRPGAALTYPTPYPGGREFMLRTYKPAGKPGFDSYDVVGTVKLMRTQLNMYTWNSYPLNWLSPEPPSPKDNNTVRINFGLPHPDPRAVLTFKILPARWMIENSKEIDDPLFAEKPFGTGPFILSSNPRPDGSNNPRDVVFVNNPAYGQRDRTGLPSIQEVRFVEVNKIDTFKAFQEGKLHILTDVPTEQIDQFMDANKGLRGKVDIVTATVNRRVHILAVNLMKPHLQSKQLRQGISLAIDREDILRGVYRAGRDVHKAMTGPFPPSSWASVRGVSGPESQGLMNRDKAVVRLRAYLAQPNIPKEIELAYPADDPYALRACSEIKKQIDNLLKNEPKDMKLTISPRPFPMNDLLVRVQDQHSSFDLAYLPFDYPDDWYPYALGAALDPGAAVRKGRNWFSFQIPETNPDAGDQELGRALAKVRSYRDFDGQIAPQTTEIGKLFNDSLPFIPLWQLDRHMVVSKRLKIFVDDSSEMVNPRLLNPNILFQGVGRWRLE